VSFVRALVRLLLRCTLFVLVPVVLIVWLLSALRGWDFADLLYKALLVLAVVLIFIVVLSGWGGVGGREWEAQMAGRLPSAGENLRQARAEMDVSLGFSARLGILAAYTGLVAVLVYAFPH